ncbi:MAG TPA: hypothetical protein VN132_14525 [Bdellovibrio sp.]|nr:hypothetical protein [Bdellovibrio sp.]
MKLISTFLILTAYVGSAHASETEFSKACGEAVSIYKHAVPLDEKPEKCVLDSEATDGRIFSRLFNLCEKTEGSVWVEVEPQYGSTRNISVTCRR